ncbi:restriction endonuclease subunit S [Vibrio sp. SNU_ST1]|uniref:restriction endonuclease subunit S n=1 Tax=Vibrio sp. SNU_ST1 TaxID=3064001 RepID=UPI002729FE2E|nr:restriction endonuclease subunit S [Vibrio sp. SNU_ST1]WKY56865.1 restriction endonuclease subunit S [Vibrio sp. SNU_ST1]
MGSEWKKAKLTEHYEIRSGLSKPAKDFGSGYPFLTFKNVFYNYFVPSELTELVQSTEKERAGCSVQRGDVFLTRTSETMNELGMSCVALKSYENSSFNGFCKRLRPKPESDLVPEYVGYYLRSPRFRNDMLAFSTMSTRASLNNDMIGRLDISYPSPESQRKVAHVLKSFDDKITINRQTNQTLEQMAQTLFKSWFVDFDPVKAKMNGEQPKGMDAATASLFPEKLVESELGLIPDGWDIVSIKDFGSVVCGKTPPKKNDEFYGGDVPFIKIPDTHGKVFITETTDTLTQAGDESQPKKRIPENSICVSCIATVGQVFITTKPSHTNQQINSVVPYDQNSLYYLLFKFKGLNKHFHDLASGGSATLNMNTSTFSKVALVRPTADLLEAFHKTVGGLMEKMLANQLENATLSELRDTLLPKLLSGEIDLENQQVEQAKALAG